PVLCMLHSHHIVLFVLPRLPRSTLFPYTTLFRSMLRRRLMAAWRPLCRSQSPSLFAGAWVRLVVDLRQVLKVQMRIDLRPSAPTDRKSTRLNSSHVKISYAVFCLKKKKRAHTPRR